VAEPIAELERDLDSFDAKKRRKALETAAGLLKSGAVNAAARSDIHNLHFHSFNSFNYRGFSPSRIAWEARKGGFAAAGIVDFDVLSGLEEFYGAGELLGLRTCVSMETRVRVRQYAGVELNSPGEPGVSYFMGVGFPREDPGPALRSFQGGLQATSQARNRALAERVNGLLDPVRLDWQEDVLPLTPSANPTERHMCLAYARKAAALFPDRAELAAFWAKKLGTPVPDKDLPEGVDLILLIRAKTMKGARMPEGENAFPWLEDAANYVRGAGALPAHSWYDGTTGGEQDIERLLDTFMAAGCAVMNIILDRCYTPGVKDARVAALHRLVEACNARNLPIVVGTEMNKHGQKLVDSFETAELAPLLPSFLNGAFIVYAHAMLKRHTELGYLDEWAVRRFPDLAGRNAFFGKLGHLLKPGGESVLAGCGHDPTPDAVMGRAVE